MHQDYARTLPINLVGRTGIFWVIVSKTRPSCEMNWPTRILPTLPSQIVNFRVPSRWTRHYLHLYIRSTAASSTPSSKLKAAIHSSLFNSLLSLYSQRMSHFLELARQTLISNLEQSVLYI